MDYQVFKDDKEKLEARETLASLIEHPGWRWLQKALKFNEEYLSRQLHDKRDFANLEELYALQDRIDDFIAFQNLPAILIKETQIDPPEEDSEIYDLPGAPTQS